jgi:hypothetical protein
LQTGGLGLFSISSVIKILANRSGLSRIFGQMSGQKASPLKEYFLQQKIQEFSQNWSFYPNCLCLAKKNHKKGLFS